MFDWTPEADALLRKMRVEMGMPFSEVGKVFGVSRNACIGRARRLGIVSPPAVTASNRFYGSRERITKTKAPPVFVPEGASLSSCTLRDLEPYQCRWPINDAKPGEADETLFCGLPRQAGGCYCERHSLRGFIPSKPKASTFVDWHDRTAPTQQKRWYASR